MKIAAITNTFRVYSSIHMRPDLQMPHSLRQMVKRITQGRVINIPESDTEMILTPLKLIDILNHPEIDSEKIYVLFNQLKNKIYFVSLGAFKLLDSKEKYIEFIFKLLTR